MAATVWRGRLAFGMVSIPVRLYKAARRERMRFHHVYRRVEEVATPADEEPEPEARSPEAPAPQAPAPEAVARTRSMTVSEIDEAPIERTGILKGYEVEKDHYAVFEPREIAALRPRTSSDLDILEFVHLEEIDPVYFDASYYVAPDAGGEKAYALLCEALHKTGYVALGKLAMHGREHATVIRPGNRGLILHTIFYAKEVRSAEEYQADSNLVSTKELDMATLLVRALAAKFEPAKLKDAFEERLRELVQTRARTAVTAEAHREAPRQAPVIDIMEALRKSLEMARKPPKTETRVQPKRRART